MRPYTWKNRLYIMHKLPKPGPAPGGVGFESLCTWKIRLYIMHKHRKPGPATEGVGFESLCGR
jgi:hypothetical protein